MPPNDAEISTSTESPTVSVASPSVPTATGGWSCTVTANVCVALPAVFSAVTVTVASPIDSASTVTVVPDNPTRAISAADEVTEYRRLVPEYAAATSTGSASPIVIVASGNWPTASGG